MRKSTLTVITSALALSIGAFPVIMPTASVKAAEATQYTVEANDISFTHYLKDNNGKLTEEEAIKLASASVSDSQKEQFPEYIKTDQAELDAINNATEDGNYKLTFYADDGQIIYDSTTVNVDVFVKDEENPDAEADAEKDAIRDPNVISDDDPDGEDNDAPVGDGNDINEMPVDAEKDDAPVDAVDAINDNDAANDGDAADKPVDDANAPDDASAPDDAKKDDEKKDDDIVGADAADDPANEEYIDSVLDSVSRLEAEDFEYRAACGNFDDALAAELASITAYDKDDKAITDRNAGKVILQSLMVDSADIESIRNGVSGTYDITFSLEKDISVTVRIEVIGDLDNGSIIDANNFTYDLANGELTASKVKQYSSLKVSDEKGKRIPNSQVEISKEDLDTASMAAAGSTTGITITAPDGSRKIVMVTFTNSNAGVLNLMKTLIALLLGIDTI